MYNVNLKVYTFLVNIAGNNFYFDIVDDDYYRASERAFDRFSALLDLIKSSFDICTFIEDPIFVEDLPFQTEDFENGMNILPYLTKKNLCD